MIAKCKKCGGDVMLDLSQIYNLVAGFNLTSRGEVGIGVAQIFNSGISKFNPTFKCTSCGSTVEEFDILCSHCMKPFPVSTMVNIANSQGNLVNTSAYCISCVQILLPKISREEYHTEPIQYKNLSIQVSKISSDYN